MSPAAVILLIAGLLVLAAAALAVAREAVKRNWVKCSLALSITTPDQRLPKPPKTTAGMVPAQVPDSAVSSIDRKVS